MSAAGRRVQVPVGAEVVVDFVQEDGVILRMVHANIIRSRTIAAICDNLVVARVSPGSFQGLPKLRRKSANLFLRMAFPAQELGGVNHVFLLPPCREQHRMDSIADGLLVSPSQGHSSRMGKCVCRG